MLTKRDIDGIQADLNYRANMLLLAIQDIKSATTHYDLNFGNSWIHTLADIGMRLLYQQNELKKIKNPVARQKLEMFRSYIESEIKVLNKLMIYFTKKSLDYILLEEIEGLCESLIGVSQQAPDEAKAIDYAYSNSFGSAA